MVLRFNYDTVWISVIVFIYQVQTYGNWIVAKGGSTDKST